MIATFRAVQVAKAWVWPKPNLATQVCTWLLLPAHSMRATANPRPPTSLHPPQSAIPLSAIPYHGHFPGALLFSFLSLFICVSSFTSCLPVLFFALYLLVPYTRCFSNPLFLCCSLAGWLACGLASLLSNFCQGFSKDLPCQRQGLSCEQKKGMTNLTGHTGLHRMVETPSRATVLTPPCAHS